MLAVYISTKKSAEQLRQDETLLTNWMVTNRVAKSKWFRDPTDVSGIPSSQTFSELIADFEEGRVDRVLSLDLAAHLDNLSTNLPSLSRLLSITGSLLSPGVESKPFSLVAQETLAAAAKFAADERGKRISEGLGLRKASGSPVGGRQGNTNRKDKFLAPDPRLLDEIRTMMTDHTDREIAARVGVSAATVCRYRKRFLSAPSRGTSPSGKHLDSPP